MLVFLVDPTDFFIPRLLNNGFFLGGFLNVSFCTSRLTLSLSLISPFVV